MESQGSVELSIPATKKSSERPRPSEAPNRLFLATLGVLSTKIAGAGSSFLLFILVARLLNLKEAGVFFTAFAVTPIVIILVNLGLDQVMLREVAAYRERAVLTCRRALAFILACALLLSVAMFPLGYFAVLYLKQPDLIWLIPALGIAAAILGVVYALTDIMRGMGSLIFSSFAMYACFSFTCLALLLALMGWCYFEGGLITLSMIVSTFFVAAIITLCIAFFGCYLLLPNLFARVCPISEALTCQALLGQGMPLMITVLAITLFNFVDTWVLAYYRPAGDVAIYGAALRIANLVTFIMASVERTVTPTLASAFHAGQLQRVSLCYRQAVLIAFGLGIPLCVAIWFAAPYLLGLYGDAFRTGATALCVLALGQLANAATGPAEQLLSVAKFGMIMSRWTLVMAGVDLLLNLTLAPRYGVLGTAIATAVSIAVLNVCHAFLVWRYLGIVPPLLPLPIERANGEK